MSRISIYARTHEQVQRSGDGEIWLIKISHPSLPEPVRISSYPAAQVSRRPKAFATRSTWNGAESAGAALTYDFLLLDVVPPAGQTGRPHSAQIALMTVDDGPSKALRSITDYARVDMAGVMLSSPDHVEVEFWKMCLLEADIQTAQVLLTIGRLPTEQRRSIAGRFTAERTPGLFG